MKNIILTSLLFSLITFSTNAQVRWDFSVDYLFESEGTAFFDPPNRYSGLGSAVLLRVSPLFEIGEHFIGGPYVSTIPSVEIFRFDVSPTLFELGFQIGPRFEIAGAHELRAMAQIGYRQWITSDEFISSNGLATNLNITFEFNKENALSPKVEIGFLTQPTGGNDEVFISFSPYWYVGGGIVLKK